MSVIEAWHIGKGIGWEKGGPRIKYLSKRREKKGRMQCTGGIIQVIFKTILITQ